MKYKIILTIAIVLIIYFTGCFNLERYYCDENNQIDMIESSKDMFGFSLYYPHYAVKNSSLMMPGNEKFFKFLEGKYYYQISFGTEDDYSLESLQITILDDEDKKIIPEDGVMNFHNQTQIYNSLEKMVNKNLPDSFLLHIYFDDKKLSNVAKIIIKINIILSKDKNIKQFEFTKKLTSKYRLITPLDFYH